MGKRKEDEAGLYDLTFVCKMPVKEALGRSTAALQTPGVKFRVIEKVTLKHVIGETAAEDPQALIAFNQKLMALGVLPPPSVRRPRIKRS